MLIEERRGKEILCHYLVLCHQQWWVLVGWSRFGQVCTIIVENKGVFT